MCWWRVLDEVIEIMGMNGSKREFGDKKLSFMSVKKCNIIKS